MERNRKRREGKGGEEGKRGEGGKGVILCVNSDISAHTPKTTTTTV